MGLSKKLKQQTEEQTPAVDPNACKMPGCNGIYIPTDIALVRENGVLWEVMFTKNTCYKCGHLRTYVFEGKKRPVLYKYYAGIYYKNPINFYVPREMIEAPVYDTKGVPVLGKNGDVVFRYDPEKKLDFLRRVCSLVNWKSPLMQRFTLSEIMNAKPSNIFF